MQRIKRVFNCVTVFLLSSSIFLWATLSISNLLKIVVTVGLFICYAGVHIKPFHAKKLPGRIRLLGSGCELILTAAVCTVLLCVAYFYLWKFSNFQISGYQWLLNSAVAFFVISFLLANALIRLFFSSGQITLVDRVALLLLWWIPILNLALFYWIVKKAYREYRFEVLKYNRNAERKEQRICATKYPILLVHGIFFRDWKLLNYWGRVPKELQENGARLYYGRQQSSSSVEQSAQELKECILQIVEEEGCEKVNIIAHSKGGLDARYAVSCLGMDKYTASLTTINTPHRGCRFARNALDHIPEKLVSSVSKKYNAIFSKLGDHQPDFFTGVSELTDKKCTQFNENTPDRKGVLYQSVGSRMKKAGSAPFPLNLSYSIVKAIDGDNDGLVTVESMLWGAFTMLEPTGKKGISHGDMIDLTRKDIDGFDVCEFYAGLVHGLKEKGL